MAVSKAKDVNVNLEDIYLHKLSWLERSLGPEMYRVSKALVKNPLSVAGLVILGVFILVAVFAPVIAPPARAGAPYQIPRDGFSPDPRPPMSEWRRLPPPTAFWLKPLTGSEEWVHLLGTTSGQWDIFYGIVWGTRTAFRVGLIITIATVSIGILLGTLSAYYGGIIDMIIMRITDVFLTMPFLIAALVLSAILSPIFGKSILAPMIALIVFGWMSYARLIRGDILSIKERDYVTAARVVGSRDSRIMLRHILPNAIFPTLVVSSMDMGSYVITFAALSFLGIGAEVGYADWGQLLSFARNWITQLNDYWYIVVYPGIALVLFVLSWNLIGDAVRDIFDPRMRGRGA
jgi:peptide/nickel transport system permease protein